ncbi:MAG: LptF/LptG family permease [Sedimentisphaerales bacterium]
MTLTLHKYIFRELFRVFLLTLIALTLILSLGSILQPIQQYGAGPRQVMIFMFYFLPITLTFVLPMAALFAGALVYGRFTSDNELDACRASGISILSLVLPGLLLAIVVAISNLFLSFYVMPTFVQLAEKSLKADIKQMLFRSLEQKGYYQIPGYEDYLLYADYADARNDTLYGVVLTRVEGIQIKEINTTESAKIKIVPHEQSNEIQITPHNIYRFSTDHAVKVSSTVVTTEFGSLLADNIAFKKLDEMREIKNDLTKFAPIAKSARDTLTQLTIELLAFDIRNNVEESIQTDPNSNSLSQMRFELAGEPNSVRFTLSHMTLLKNQINFSGDIDFIESDTASGRTIHHFKSKDASLRIESNLLEHTLAMDLRNATDPETGEIKMWHSVTGLKVPRNIERTIDQFNTSKGSINAMKLASGVTDVPGFAAGPELAELEGALKSDILNAQADMKAEIHSRLVFGLGCILMIMIGIGLGILKRGGHLLSAFGASCVPAAILVVCIMSGKQLTENLGAQTVSGITIMWAGFGTLCLIALSIYYYLLKN